MTFLIPLQLAGISFQLFVIASILNKILLAVEVRPKVSVDLFFEKKEGEGGGVK